MPAMFTVPRAKYVDTIGRPLAGAKAYFYAPGTTTPKTVYQDNLLAVPHAFPVIADSGGQFPVIFYGTGQYKVTITTSADVAVYTADNIDPGLTTGNGAISILQGGTGATTASAARTNLGAATQSSVDALAASVAALTASLASNVGKIFYYPKSTPPAGALECNGQAVARTGTYAALFAVIGTAFGIGDGSTTFNVPELRGEFIRSWDDARGIDAARVFGSAQGMMLEDHIHISSLPAGSTGAGAFISQGSTSGATNVSTGNPTTGTHGAETRPRNIALLPCIGY